MEKLNFQDAAFLNMESASHPFHIGALMILKAPEGAPANYFRKLGATLGRLNEVWPIFNRKLENPEEPGSSGWVIEDNYSPGHHIHHYALPQPGKMNDALQLVCRAHERQLDRYRPLWEMHIIEGLPRGRFALYCKAHHALLDGAAALQLSRGLLSDNPRAKIDLGRAEAAIHKEHGRRSLINRLASAGHDLLDQYRALPEITALLAHMGMAALRGSDDTMKMPFTAPRSLFNTEIDPSREVVTCDLPLPRVKALAKTTGGSINDVLLSICGGALRTYLQGQQALPRKSLLAGMPVAIRSEEPHTGNHLSFIISPFFTNEKDPLKRLKKVIKVTRSAKQELASVSTTAARDYSNLIMIPTMLLTLTGNATRVTPAINAIFSNVPGPRERLFLQGAELESMYPLSVVTAGMGINLTVVSYNQRLCFAVTSCPTEQPGIDQLGKYLKESYRELAAAIAQESS